MSASDTLVRFNLGPSRQLVKSELRLPIQSLSPHEVMSNNANSTSPFEIFRRNLKPLMVLLTVLALFSFVVLPVVQTAMNQGGGGGGGNEVVARFGGMEVTGNQVEYLTGHHFQTVRFLREIGEETIQRGGQPKVAGFRQNPQTGDIEGIGIPINPSPELTVRTLAYANAAVEDGFELDDSSLATWLEQYTDNQFSSRDLDAKLMQSSGNKMARQHLFVQLRNHLLARIYNRRGGATLVSSNGLEIKTPLQQWEAFLKLRRSATINAYGVLVDDYINATNAEPSPAQIETVYQEGKERDSFDQSPLPAFHKRATATIQSLVGDREKFIAEEVEKITEEQLRAEYDRRRTGGDFQLPVQDELDFQDMIEQTESTENAISEAADSMEESDDSPDSSEPAVEEETAVEEPAVEETAADETAMEETAMEDVVDDAVDSVTEPKPEPSPEPKTGDQSSVPAGNDSSVRLVAMMQDESSEASDETAAVETEADETEAADETETAAEQADDDGGPKYKAFEDVKEQIARDLAIPPAEARINAATNEINGIMRRYFTSYAIWEGTAKGDPAKAGDPPSQPDLKALAEKLDFEFVEIGPHDEITIGDEAIADSFANGGPNRARGFAFRYEMFGIPSQDRPGLPLFAPLRSVDDQTGVYYVSWKIDETEAYTPELDEVRDDVIRYIRRQEAKELAKEAAEKMVQQLNQTDADLKSLVPEDRTANYYEGLGPFTHLQIVGQFRVARSNVPELDSIGEEFMNAVFSTDVDAASMAINQPERAVYVIVPTAFDPATDDLKEQFRQPFNRQMASLIASGTSEIQDGFVKNIEAKTGLEELFR